MGTFSVVGARSIPDLPVEELSYQKKGLRNQKSRKGRGRNCKLEVFPLKALLELWARRGERMMMRVSLVKMMLMLWRRMLFLGYWLW